MSFRRPNRLPRVVRRAGLPDLQRARYQQSAKEWDAHPDLKLFLQDFFPGRWSGIQLCGRRFVESRAASGDDRWKIRHLGCHELPYCIVCVKLEGNRRVAKTMDKFRACTPKGFQPSFFHVVQTAPSPMAGEPDGRYLPATQPWAHAALDDAEWFSQIVYDTAADHMGGELGVVASFQAFGERGPAHSHPHIDFTINGWSLRDGAPVKTPRPELEGNGRRKWDRSLAQLASKRVPGAGRGNLWVGKRVVGVAAYWAQMRYQMREMMDFRKLRYNRDASIVGWVDYNTGHVTRMTARDFLQAFIGYQEKFGSWSRNDRQTMHRRYGHLADRNVGATSAKMGGEVPKHRSNCICSECSDWERAGVVEVERGGDIIRLR